MRIDVKKYLYRTYLGLLAIAAAYALFGIVHFKWVYHKVDKPVSFQVTGNLNSEATLIEFMNYSCIYCKELHPTVKELLNIRKDIKYVARPIAFDEGPSIRLTKIAMAAGLQGKFWEMHNAILENPNVIIDDAFIEETSNLFGIDYAQLQEDMEGNKVEKLMQENLDAFTSSGAQYVPSFLMGSRIYIMSQEMPTLTDLLDLVASELN